MKNNKEKNYGLVQLFFYKIYIRKYPNKTDYATPVFQYSQI